MWHHWLGTDSGNSAFYLFYSGLFGVMLLLYKATLIVSADQLSACAGAKKFDTIAAEMLDADQAIYCSFIAVALPGKTMQSCPSSRVVTTLITGRPST